MEFDQPKKPENTADSKESKKKKSPKRTPSHVPLPVDERIVQAHDEAAAKDETFKKKKKRNRSQKSAQTEKEEPKHAEAAAEKPLENADKVSKKPDAENDTKIDDVSHEATDEKIAETDAHLDPEGHEAEVLLHDVSEGEVFVSERWKQTDETETSANEDSSEAAAEIPTQPEDIATETADDEPEATSTTSGTSSSGTWRQNPQQQQQKRASSQSSGASAAAASPFLAQWRNRNSGGNQPPQPPYTGATARGAGGPVNPNAQTFAQSPNTAPITSTPAPERVRDRASERRHLVTGLVVGALVEHIRHKRREKRMEKAHAKEVKSLQKEQAGAHIERQAEQAKQLREKTALEQTIERLKKKPASAERPVLTKTSENTAAVASSPTAEQPKTIEEAKKDFEKRARQAVEIAHEPEEELEIPKEHRLEQSAWHAIEIDKKTGKAVENASFGYGEAFRQEQHQEQLRKEVAEAAGDSDEAREKYKAAKQVAPPALPYNQHPALPEGPSKGDQLRDKTMAAAQTAADMARHIQPVDALLWLILGVVVLIILKLL
jgi:hypothetical protein